MNNGDLGYNAGVYWKSPRLQVEHVVFSLQHPIMKAPPLDP